MDGKDGRDGKDGVGFDEWRAEYDGERKFSIICGTKQFDFVLPFPIFRDKWQEGKYYRGDEVTFGGQVFRALLDTTSKPGHSSDWAIGATRGRDGRDGKDGQKGDQGPPGPRGMDLTQLGQDGKKWG